MNENVAFETQEQGSEGTARRQFLTRVSVILGSLGAALAAIPSVGFLLGLRKTPQIWRTVGKLDDFQIGSTVNVAFRDSSPLPWSGVTAQTAAWHIFSASVSWARGPVVKPTMRSSFSRRPSSIMTGLIDVHTHLGWFSDARLSADGNRLCGMLRQAG